MLYALAAVLFVVCLIGSAGTVHAANFSGGVAFGATLITTMLTFAGSITLLVLAASGH